MTFLLDLGKVNRITPSRDGGKACSMEIKPGKILVGSRFWEMRGVSYCVQISALKNCGDEFGRAFFILFFFSL